MVQFQGRWIPSKLSFGHRGNGGGGLHRGHLELNFARFWSVWRAWSISADSTEGDLLGWVGELQHEDARSSLKVTSSCRWTLRITGTGLSNTKQIKKWKFNLELFGWSSDIFQLLPSSSSLDMDIHSVKTPNLHYSLPWGKNHNLKCNLWST